MPGPVETPGPCWCSKPSHKAEVECSACRCYSHYECLGLSVDQLSELINSDGLYLCRTCGPKTKKAARDNLRKANPNSLIFEFDPDTHSMKSKPTIAPTVNMADLEKAIDQRMATFETNIMTSVINMSTAVSKSMQSSYATIAKKVSPDKPRITPVIKSQIYRADPRRSVLVSKISDPKRFFPVSVKESISKARPDLSSKVSYARLLNSGKLIIETWTTEDRALLLDGWSPEFFGPISQIAAMDLAPTSGKFKNVAIIHGIDPSLTEDECLAQLSQQFDSIANIEFLPRKSFSGKCNSAKLQMSSDDQFSNLTKYGCKLDFQHFRASPFVSKPTRCFHCQRFGHVASACKSAQRCRNCGSDSCESLKSGSECDNPVHCCNCGDPHDAANVRCKTFIERFNQLKASSIINV